ncbi:ABC transporter substrate-binding protein [Streptomyces sp. NPDC048636]|uniref:caspase, EACC1-associated type n=1 Tax=Streptomyces sp. NPDC048636 TaxID=3155762 RepID=UPI0034472070
MTVLPDPAASRAVLIGTSDYAHLESIPAVSANLGALAAALCSPRSWDLAPEHCTVIEDPLAAMDVLEAVRTAAEEATDTLLVYFAGHGLVEPRRGELYLGLTRSMPQRSYTGLPYGALRDVVLDGRAGRQVMLLDCCFSGRALGFMGTASSVIDQVETEGTYLLAAVPDTSYALAPPGEPHTAFTGELLGLLRDGMPGGPELLDLDTVYAQVHAALRAKGRPLPQKRARNSAGKLALARNVAWVPPGFGPPPPPYESEPEPLVASGPPSAALWTAPPKPTWSPAAITGHPRRRRRIRNAVVGAVSLALLAAGIPLVRGWIADDPPGDEGKPSSTASGQPKDGVVTTGYGAAAKGVVNPSKRQGGELRFIAEREDSWDPQRMYSSYGWNFARYFTRQLVTWSTAPGAKSTELVADLAKSTAKVTDGGRTYTYTLREGVTWEDGKPVTPYDIKYGIERAWASDVIIGGPDYLRQVLDPKGTYEGPYKDKGKAGLKAIVATEDTIVFHLPKPDADFEQLLAMPAASPVPKDKDNGEKYGDDPFSSGPYMFDTYTAGKSLRLKRNPHWKPKSDPIRTALPHTIRLDVDDNPGSRGKALFSGRYDLELAPAALTRESWVMALARGDLKDQLDNPHTELTRFLALPWSVKPLDNVHCRRAIQFAVDREAVQSALGGPGAGGDLAATLLPPSIPGSRTDADGKPDSAKAKRELEDCGRKNGFSTTIAVRRDRQPERDAAEAVHESLKKAGITTRIEEIPFGEFPTTTGSPNTVKKKGYGIIIAAWGADFPTGQGFLRSLADGRLIQPTGNFNLALVNSGSINERLDDAIADQNTERAAESYAQIDKDLVKDAAYVPLVFSRGYSWRSTRLTNVHTSRVYSGGYDFATLGVTG